MDEPQAPGAEREQPDTEEPLCVAPHTGHVPDRQLQRQEAGQWSSEAGAGMGVTANGDGVSFLGDEDIFEQDRSNGAHYCECVKCH